MPWVSGKQRFTRALMVTVASWTRVLPWKEVAKLFRCAWGTVAGAVDAAVVYGLAHHDLSGVRHANPCRRLGARNVLDNPNPSR